MNMSQLRQDAARRRKVAIHEAGHAVMAHHFDLAFNVDIEPAEGWSGMTTTEKPSCQRDRYAIAVAGAVAEFLFLKPHPFKECPGYDPAIECDPAQVALFMSREDLEPFAHLEDDYQVRRIAQAVAYVEPLLRKYPLRIIAWSRCLIESSRKVA